jgi:hypothetical protein
VWGQSKKLAQVARIQARGQLYIPNPDEDPDDQEAEFDEALAAFGLQQVVDSDKPDKPDEPDYYYLWPDNVPTFNIWQRLQTQWRVGAGGATGLDYTACVAYMREVARVKKQDFRELFMQLQSMENATLAEWKAQQASS